MIQNRGDNIKNKYTLKNDVFFKALFGKKGNEAYLKDFLSDLLNLEIRKIEILKDASLEKNAIDEKLGILDIKASLNNDKIVDIEMQVLPYNYFIKRIEFYGSKLVIESLKAGNGYDTKKDAIVVSILDYNMFLCEEYLTETVIVNKNHRDIEIIRSPKYYFIELPKFRKARKNYASKIECWLELIDYQNKEGVDLAMKNNNLIKKANQEFEYLTGDAELKRIAELKEKLKIDEAFMYQGAYDEGIKAGIDKGIKKGIEKGIEKNSIDIAKKMLNENVDIDFISKITGLSKDKILEL